MVILRWQRMALSYANFVAASHTTINSRVVTPHFLAHVSYQILRGRFAVGTFHICSSPSLTHFLPENFDHFQQIRLVKNPEEGPNYPPHA